MLNDIFLYLISSLCRFLCFAFLVCTWINIWIMAQNLQFILSFSSFYFYSNVISTSFLTFRASLAFSLAQHHFRFLFNILNIKKTNNANSMEIWSKPNGTSTHIEIEIRFDNMLCFASLWFIHHWNGHKTYI
jgi:hypothetical protein